MQNLFRCSAFTPHISELFNLFAAPCLRCTSLKLRWKKKKMKFCKYLKKTTRYAHNQKGKVSNSIVRTFPYPAISMLCTFQPFKIKFVLFSSRFNILFFINFFFPVFQISNQMAVYGNLEQNYFIF